MKPSPLRLRRALLARAAPCVFVLWLAPGATAATAADAQKGAPGPALVRHAIAGGGGTSSGGAHALQGTIGQADADPLQPSSGGVFTVTGGFWPGIPGPAPTVDALFAHGFED